MMRRFAFTCLTLAPVIAFAANFALAQDAISIPKERLIVLGAYVDSRSLHYGASPPETAVVFSGDPVEIVVEVGNQTDNAVDLGTSQREWARSLRFKLQRGRGTSGVTPFPITARRIGSGPDGPLAPGRGRSSRFSILDESGSPPPAGLYTLEVSLDDVYFSAPTRRLRNILSRELKVEVRAVESNTDRIDQYLQRAYRARGMGQLAEARRWANLALDLNPNSLPATMDLADAWFAEGNCSAAVPTINRALSLLDTNGDPSLVREPHNELASALRNKLARCIK